MSEKGATRMRRPARECHKRKLVRLKSLAYESAAPLRISFKILFCKGFISGSGWTPLVSRRQHGSVEYPPLACLDVLDPTGARIGASFSWLQFFVEGLCSWGLWLVIASDCAHLRALKRRMLSRSLRSAMCFIELLTCIREARSSKVSGYRL